MAHFISWGIYYYNYFSGVAFHEVFRAEGKDVINCRTGDKLGCVIDLEFDPASGQIICLIVPKATKILCFTKGEFYYIPYKKIIRIGCDTVLVDINEKECLK